VGNYRLRIQGTGTVTGSVPLTQVTSSAAVVNGVNVPATFVALSATTAQAATISMSGYVDLAQRSATLTIVFQNQPLALVDFVPSTSLAPAQALAAGQAAVGQQWSVLYSMMAFEQQQIIPESQFAAAMGASGYAISQVQLGAAGTSDAQGDVLYWHQPMIVTATPPGGASHTYAMTMNLIAEGGQWRCVSTSSSAPS
jgi:hypothetical protein